jgi:hypothetical protein
LLFPLLNGMILGHDADRRHPRPDDQAALARGRLAVAASAVREAVTSA